MSAWAAWLGREEIRRDRVDPGHFTRWLATLDRAAPADGTVPQGYHWCLCLPDAPGAALGIDGHPQRDDSLASFFPPVPQPRRMWAASKVEFLAPLQVNEDIERISRIASITEKSGASGNLVFVDVAQEMRGRGAAAIRETQTLVYRDPPPAGSPPSPPPLGEGRFHAAGWESVRTITPGEALLFRFSALTFNTHRIHYDYPYATRQEGYLGLVVHGPLTASLLLGLLAREVGENALRTFAFRAVSPALCGEPLHLALRKDDAGWECGAFADDGRQVLSASAS